jgi:hypothetical protein
MFDLSESFHELDSRSQGTEIAAALFISGESVELISPIYLSVKLPPILKPISERLV